MKYFIKFVKFKVNVFKFYYKRAYISVIIKPKEINIM